MRQPSEDTPAHDKMCLVTRISTPGVVLQLLPGTRCVVGPLDITLDALRDRFRKLRHPSTHKSTKWLQCSVLCSHSTSGANIWRKRIYTRQYKAKRSLASPKSALRMLQTGPEHAKQRFGDFPHFQTMKGLDDSRHSRLPGEAVCARWTTARESPIPTHKHAPKRGPSIEPKTERKK